MHIGDRNTHQYIQVKNPTCRVKHEVTVKDQGGAAFSKFQLRGIGQARQGDCSNDRQAREGGCSDQPTL